MRSAHCIFAADDDEDDLMLLQAALQEAGADCRLQTFGDGEELLHHLNSADQVPALVLLDLNMPVMNGFQTLQKIRQSERYQALPVIIITTSSDQRDVVRSYELGANTFLTKPANYRKFTEMMRLMSMFWLNVAKLPSHTNLVD